MKAITVTREMVEYCIAHPELSRDEIRKNLKCGNNKISEILSLARSGITDADVILQNVTLAKGLQKQQDSNRIKNKTFREFARLDNSLVEISNEIKSILSKYDLSKITKKHDNKGDKSCGIIHLSDWHLNELVSIDGNKYDFTVASKRMKQFASKARLYLKSHGIKNVLVANSGDNLNSDRRLDEYLNQATNRMNAMMLSVYLLEQFLVDLNSDFNIQYAHVVGNESRVKDEPAWADIVASDNYDSSIFNILRYSMKSAKGIEFILGSPQELVVNVAGQNVLLVHGQQIRGKVGSTITQIVGKYASIGTLIDFVIFGDVHESRIADNYARGSSAVGSNAYSWSGLQLAGRASQNVHIFYENKNRDSIKIDLQNIEKGIDGYDIIKDLEAYNSKSVGRLHKGTVIHQVVI